jgi:hypothetical protein
VNQTLLSVVLLAAILAPGDVPAAETPSQSAPPGFPLVSEQEAAADRVAQRGDVVVNRTLESTHAESGEQAAAAAPVIEVLSPDATKGLHSPINIDIRFRAPPRTMIALHTVRLRYGVMQLDLTERIRNMGSVTKDGIRAYGAELPVGQHSMTVEVEDTRGVRARSRFTLNVVR